MNAIKQGLKLEPGDYEFLTLQQEINAGATLEQMEYHWINPDADQTLQQGLDEEADDKQLALACIRVDETGLAEFYELFHPERYGYEKNSPCCEFQYPVEEHLVELSFRMNEAGLSKMGTDWLRQLKERLDNGEWLTHTPEGCLLYTSLRLMQTLAACYHLAFKELYAFSRWGQSCTTGLFEKGGREFVFVPGDTVILGWEMCIRDRYRTLWRSFGENGAHRSRRCWMNALTPSASNI